ncbi:hypothetical protein VTK73DRAFT_6369 [Phialemonium thermophilum]|uniref:Uncharacterized protein n=1 Tax=Phialemonium thermophilum TaxID=223376 RepID=A0ABR3V0Q7_9PEZI
MLADNVKAFLRQVKDDVAALEDEVEKKIEEVVLSTTNGPGFSLNGTFPPTDDKIQPAHLAGPIWHFRGSLGMLAATSKNRMQRG